MSCVDPLVPGFFFFFSLAYLIVRCSMSYTKHAERCRPTVAVTGRAPVSSGLLALGLFRSQRFYLEF